MQRVYSSDDLLNGTIVDTSVPLFLDTTSWSAFYDWVTGDATRLNQWLSQDGSVWIFAEELQHTQPNLYAQYTQDIQSEKEEDVGEETSDDESDEETEPIRAFEDQLENRLRVKINPEKLPSRDAPLQTFLYEVKDVYFGEVVQEYNRDRHAEFMYLARRAARNEDKLRILTAKSAFSKVAKAEVFMIPVPQPQKLSLPADFDVFTNLAIHPRIRQVVEIDFRNGDYPKVVYQAVNAFRDYLRHITNLPNDDGVILADKVFELKFSGGLVQADNNGNLPPLLINKIAIGDQKTLSEVNEQDGFHRFAQGVFKAIRNPNAHQTHTDPFIQSRFNDEKTAIKVLCFLSTLCERIDSGKRHSP